jgi:hypothetical protein
MINCRQSYLDDGSNFRVSSNYFSTKQKRQQALKALRENLDLSFSIAVVGGSQVGKFTMVNSECADEHGKNSL